MASMLSKPPRLRSLIGPSLILLGLGLGSGELILWPYLVANHGLGIIWIAALGITFQFFINMEIERYSLIKGETVFVGFAKAWKAAPYWLIFSTLIAWVWPGIIATSAKIISEISGYPRFDYIAIALLLAIGIILTTGKQLYTTVERMQKLIIGFGVPAVALLTFSLATSTDWAALTQGLVGIGEGYRFLPRDISLLTLLGAFAYSGAGGNLNLAQSSYVREKGYGMCKGAKGISSVLTGKAEQISLEGKEFANTPANRRLFAAWWRLVNIEHAAVFLGTGLVTILMVALLAYAVMGNGSTVQGIQFLIAEGKQVGILTSPLFGSFFLAVIAVMLFATQLTVLDSTSRIIAENAVVIHRSINLSKAYYAVLWLQIAGGVTVFLSGFADPLTLVITSAVLNAVAMFVHIGMTALLNRKSLPKELQPGMFRKSIIGVIWVFFGVFSGYTLWESVLR